METLTGTYDIVFVTLSFVISVLGSFTALLLAQHLPGAARSVSSADSLVRSEDRRFWIACAAFAMGGGAVWSMHFIGMVAFDLGVTVRYHPGITLLSLVIAVAASAAGLSIVSPRPDCRRHLIAGGTFMGLGVAAMHYTGMAAMRMPASLSYAPGLVALSVVIAVVACTAALWFAFRCDCWSVISSGALIMATAVCGMHYTAMAATRFTRSSAVLPWDAPALSPEVLAYIVFLLSLVTLSIGVSFAVGMSRVRVVGRES